MARSDLAGITIIWGTFLLCSSLCTIFIISFWKSHFMKQLDVSDSTMSTLLLVLDMFAFFTYLPGLILDHKGPVALVLGSAVLNVLGYGILALTVNEVLPLGLAFVGFAVAGQGSMWSVVASLGLIGRNIAPQEKGKGIGLAMAWFSLSACVVESVPQTFGGAGIESVFLVIGGVMLAVDLLVAFALAAALSKGPSQRSGAAVGLPWNLALVVLVTLGVFVKAYSDSVQTLMQWLFIGLLALGGAAAVLLALRLRGGEGASQQALVAGEASGSSVGEAMRDPRYWIVFAIFAMLVSTGMLVNNRLVGLSDAAGLTSHSVMLSAFSVGNTSSRVFFGYFSDVLAKRIPRHWFLVLDSWLMLLAYAVLMLCVGQAEAPKDATTIGVFIGGFAFGAPWMMVPAIEMHWYGQAKFGTIHGIMMFATAVGLILVRIGNAMFTSLHGVVSFCLAFAGIVALFGTAGFSLRDGMGKKRATSPEQAGSA